MNQAHDPAEHPVQSTDDVFEVIGTARAMRWLRPDPVPGALIERVLWAATRAPSPDNVQPWEFVVIRDAQVRQKIGELFGEFLGSQAAQAAGSSVPEPANATERRTREGAMHLVSTLADVPVIAFVCGRNEYPSANPDITIMYSALYAAAQNMALAARAQGLGTVLTTLHRLVETKLRDLLAIPDGLIIGATMPIGWPARRFGPLTRRPFEDVVHYDRW